MRTKLATRLARVLRVECIRRILRRTYGCDIGGLNGWGKG